VVGQRQPLGTIRFTADGKAPVTWSDVHAWRIDANGDLIISAAGTTWVTRFVYDAAAGSFAGTRDKTSQVQDGVKAVLKPAP